MHQDLGLAAKQTVGEIVRPAWPHTFGGLLTLGGLILAGVAGCAAERPNPQPPVTALVEGLVAGDVTNVQLQGTSSQEATKQLQDLTAGMGQLRPSIRVGEIVVGDEGERASANLEYTWDLDPGAERDWTYTTEADLVLVDQDWQIAWNPDLLAPDLAADETVMVRRSAAPRGDIVGAGAEAIVTDRPVLRLGLDKTLVDPPAQPGSARRIAEVLNLDPDSYAEQVAATGSEAFVEGLVVRSQEPEVDLEKFAAIPGARSLEATLPLAPTREFARSVLGVAGPATAEIVEASEGMIQPGDIAGLSGLQKQYDTQLRGSPKLEVLARTDGDEQEERVLFTSEATPGTDVATTIDPTVQQTAENVLEDVKGPSSIVVLRPSTSEVLALANGPGSQGQATATLGQFAPGSVFKVVSSLALLRAGLTPESPVECPETLNVDGRAFQNFPDYPQAALGTIDLRTAIANSCNTALIALRDQAPPKELIESAASLGLGLDRDLGFPAYLGNIPEDSTSTDHAASMIGQARVEVSPLSMATVAASIAAGTTVTPRLLSEAPSTDKPDTPLNDDEASALRELMRAVVTDGGAQFLRDIPGEPVLAKTGTAEYGNGDQLANHAWMIAIRGDLAVAVFVETGDYGSTTAGPLLTQLLTNLK